MRVGAIGCGNVGWNTLQAFNKRGHEVFGLDPDPGVRQRFVARFGAQSLLTHITQVAGLDVVFICVPTEPVAQTGAADLSIIRDIVEQIGRLERDPHWQPPILVQRSTCPPGTAAALAPSLTRTTYAVNPSFLAKNRQWVDSDRPPRIAYGGPLAAREALGILYAGFPGAPTYISEHYEPVELLKYIENSTDAVLISLWNEYLDLADALGVSRSEFTRMADAVADRDRFATTVRAPGGAFALGCLPKDLAAIAVTCAEYGTPHHVLEGARRTNAAVARAAGDNQTPTSELLDLTRGRILLSPVAQRLLDGSLDGVP